MSSREETEGHAKNDAGRWSELDDNVEILRQVPTFSVVPLETLRLYAYLCRRICYPEGTIIFRQGEPDTLAYILISGRVHLFREYENYSVEVRILKPYDFFGGLALLADIKRLFSARAATKVECLTLDRESFRRLHKQFPEVGIRVLEVMVKRIAQMEATAMEEFERRRTEQSGNEMHNPSV